MNEPKKFVVIDGTSLIGSKVVASLQAAGYEVVSASPSSLVNAIPEEALDQALAGATTVIDVTNTVFHDWDGVGSFLEMSSINLLAAERRAGVAHHVLLSTVGADQLTTNPYMEGKVTQEALIRNSSLPYTIVRATQYFECIENLMDAYTSHDLIRVPAIQFQPIAADDVASTLVAFALGEPRNNTVDLAGPEKASFRTIIDCYAALSGDERQTDISPEAGYFGALVTNLSLVPVGDHVVGPQTMAQWFWARGCTAARDLQDSKRNVVH